MSVENQNILFIDGPPFPTGTPHLGHITTAYMKDVMIRHFMDQPNTNVYSTIGWDCHGQSIENEVERLFPNGLSTEFKINECKNKVKYHINNWKKIYNMMGRNYNESYEFFTMNDDYKKTVYKVFKELWDKGFVYQDKKIMLFSFENQTPVSHIDAVQSEKEIEVVNMLSGFKLKNDIGDNETYLLINTSNIYHLCYNQGIGINNKYNYWLIKINNSKQFYICQEDYIKSIISAYNSVIKIRQIDINELSNNEYCVPSPNIFSKNGYLPIRSINFWHNKEDDTGFCLLVHTQSEDEYNYLEKKNIPYNVNGIFDHSFIYENYQSVFNKHILEIEPVIMHNIQKNKDSQIIYIMKKREHIPVCLKTNQRLFYYPVPSWFIKVTENKNRIKERVNDITFYPDNKYNLEKWIDDSRDWCISRNRVWGCEIPVYKHQNGNYICFDKILSKSEMKTNELIERTPFVFDSWFESSLVSFYLEKNYQDIYFDKKIMVESVEQHRGWFYSQLVVASLLDRPNPMTHIITHGSVLSETGYRMCKTKNNLPSIYNLFNQFGSEYLRLLILNSAQPRDSFKFKDNRMLTQYRNSLMFQKNSFIFLKQNIDLFLSKKNESFKLLSVDEIFSVKRDYLSHWILQELFDFQMRMKVSIETGALNNIWDAVEEIQDNISKWYIKLKKPAFKDIDGNANVCISSLFWSLHYYCKMCKSIMPLHINDLLGNLYSLNISNYDSIPSGLLSYTATKNWRDDVKNLKQIITMAKIIRHQNKHKNIQMFNTEPNQAVKMPIHKLILIHSDAKVMKALQDLREYIYQEVNAIHIEYLLQESKYIDTQLRLNYKMNLGPAAPLSRDIYRKASNISPEVVSKILRNKETVKIHFPEKMVELPLNYFMLRRSKKDHLANYDFITHRNLSILIDKEINEEMLYIYEGKLLNRKIQNLRRMGQLVPSDKIKIYYRKKENNEKLDYILEEQIKYIYPTLQVKLEPYNENSKPFIEETIESCGVQMEIGIEKILEELNDDINEDIDVEFEEDDEVIL